MEATRVLAVISFFITLQIVTTGAILCYQCSDSTEERSKAPCQFGTNSLSIQRAGHERRKRALKRFPNLKNCSHYIDDYGVEIYPFCKIEVISSFGEIRGYIRDCSTGEDFSEDFNKTLRISYKNGFVKVDNQSTCGYSSLQFANICVKLCDKDFCNGPFAGASRLFIEQTILIFGLFTLCKLFLL